MAFKIAASNSTPLAAIAIASLSNGDYGHVYIGGYVRRMVFNSTATYATDTTNHPYYVRPDDYSTAGVWVEDVGADQDEVWSLDQIVTGSLVIADDGSIRSNSKSTYADTDAGFWIGWNSTAHMVNVGNASSYFKWDGAALSIKMNTGEVFDLYGSIKINAGGTVYSVSTASNTPGFVLTDDIASPTWTNKLYQIASGQLYLDTDAATLNIRNYEDVNNGSFLTLSRTSFENWTLQSKNAGAYVQITGSTQSGAELISLYDSSTGATVSVGYTGVLINPGTPNIITMPTGVALGLGAAKGRIAFVDTTVDELNFLDCNVGIGSAPLCKLDTSGTIRSIGYGTPASGIGVEIRYYTDTSEGIIGTHNRTAGTILPLKLYGTNLLLNPDAGGNVGIGIVTPTAKLHVSGGTVSNASYNSHESTFTPTATSSAAYYNKGSYVRVIPTVSGGITNSGYAVGGHSAVFSGAGLAGILTSQYGFWAQYGTYTDTTGTITNSYGIKIDSFCTAGTITNRYSLYLSALVAGGTCTNQWALYSADTANSYFAGNLGVGIDAPVAKAHIDQASTTAAIPVLILDQADVSEPFMKLIGSAASSNLTQSLVAAADVSTATIAGYERVYVQDDGNQIADQAYYRPLYTLA